MTETFVSEPAHEPFMVNSREYIAAVDVKTARMWVPQSSTAQKQFAHDVHSLDYGLVSNIFLANRLQKLSLDWHQSVAPSSCRDLIAV